MKYWIFLLLIIMFSQQIVNAQKLTSIRSDKSGEVEQVIISLDKQFTGKSKVKISANIIELPVSINQPDELPGELGNASIFYEGNWIKIVFPATFGVGFEIRKNPAGIIIKAMDVAGLKQDARNLLQQKKFDGTINIIRKILKVAEQDGEAYYIGGLARKAMADRDSARGNKRGAKDNTYYATINFGKAKKFGYKPGQKPVVKKVVKVKDEPKPEKEKVVPAKPKVDEIETESDFSPWPFVIIIIGILVLLFFLYGQKRTIKIEDDDLPSDTAFIKGLKKTKTPDNKKMFPDVDKKQKDKQPFDFGIIDELQEGQDPDETVVYDEDVSEIGPHDLIPEIDFDIDYPVIKSKKAEAFAEEEADAINSVVKDIQKEPTQSSKKIKITASPEADNAALQVARKRLMELGSDKCRMILGMIGGGISMEEIANRQNVSVGDVELVKQYLKIRS